MKKIIFFSIVLFLSTLPVSILKSQNLPERSDIISIEDRYYNLLDSYTLEKLLLDSLQAKLNTRVKEINSEKSSSNPDEDKITSLMANSVNLSNNIDLQQRKVNSIEKSIAVIKIKLSEKYSSVIDSLKDIPQKSSVNKEETENLILLYSAKRLEVMPEIYRLSFDPYKILELNLSKSKDPTDQKIYSEYLNNAIKEVNSILSKITEESKKVNQVIELQRKANKFIEETELESNIASNNGIVGQNPNGNQDGVYSNDGSRIKNSLDNNAQVYEQLLQQLSAVKSLSVEQLPDETLQNIEKNIDLHSYEKLLKEVKKNLTEYKKLLEQKTGSSR